MGDRPYYVNAPQMMELHLSCAMINRSLPDGFGCYLVGSSLKRRDYRDVDVRFLMSDEAFDRLFAGEGRDAFWSLLCMSISTWLAERTGLPIDFQIQRRTDANRDHDGERNALGCFLDYPGELPSLLEERRVREQRKETKSPTTDAQKQHEEGT